MRDIPQEVIDHVFDYLHDDKPTLAVVSLVCWSWNLSSRVHFFHTVDFGVPVSQWSTPTMKSDRRGQLLLLRKYERLVAIIHRKPAIASLVREVKITYHSELGTSRWRVAELIFACVLDKLKRVHTLRLNRVQWAQLGASFKKSLSRICSSPDLLHLELYDCFFLCTRHLTRLIGNSPGLNILTLAYVRVEGMSFLLEERALHNDGFNAQCLSSPAGMRATLKTLTIETISIATWLSFLQDPVLCPLDISSLKKLHLSQVDNIDAARQFIEVAGSNLEYLEMWAPSSPDTLITAHGYIDLSYAPKLRHLRIFGLPWSIDLCPGVCVSRLLQNLSTPHPLEEVYILVNIVKQQSEELNWCKWRVLDDCLSQPVFPSLRKFKADIIAAASGPKYIDLDKFENQFPSLKARGILDVRSLR